MPGARNLGGCWVSKKCFDPRLAVHGFLEPLLASFPNLRVFYRTAVSYATRDGASGALLSVTAVQRAPRAGVDEWDTLTSAMLADWYAPENSTRFTKEVLDFVLPRGGGAVIDATEFGDVLATSGLPFAQGIEVPAEASRGYLSTCGQGMTVPFYATYGAAPAPSPDPWPPGSGEGANFTQQGMSWDRDWTYRRVEAPAGSDANAGAPGETSVINVGGGNDIGNVYLFYGLDSAELAQQRSAPLRWRGGVNTTALAMAEQRAYGFYHWFKANASSALRGDACASPGSSSRPDAYACASRAWRPRAGCGGSGASAPCDRRARRCAAGTSSTSPPRARSRSSRSRVSRPTRARPSS
jgi:hypothetical protein